MASVEPDGALIHTAMGPIACRKHVGSHPGSAVTVCIRPEFITVIQGESGAGQNTFRGRVESLVFIGEAYEAEVKVGGTRQIAGIEPTASLKDGDEIGLHIDPGQCSILER